MANDESNPTLIDAQELLVRPQTTAAPASHDGRSEDSDAEPHSTASCGGGLNGNVMSRTQAYNLYASHALSTWNARTYEFAAIIFTASAYPDTLTASSIRGIVTMLASIAFSSAVGRWADGSGGNSRLRTLLLTISVNRASVVAASLVWSFLVAEKAGARSFGAAELNAGHGYGEAQGPERLTDFLRGGLFVLVLLLGVLEKLSAAANMLVMERDWVVCVAAVPGAERDLTALNAVMRRIDLVCKLVAPLVISVVVEMIGIRAGVTVVGSMSALCWGVEAWCANRVWDGDERLRALRQHHVGDDSQAHSDLPLVDQSRSCVEQSQAFVQRYLRDYKHFFSTKVWIPSMALSLLHLSVLSYSATFITYLLSVGFSLNLITIARAAGSVVEITSTVITPFGVHYLGKASAHGSHLRAGYVAIRPDEDVADVQGDEIDGPLKRTETGLERLGLWGITWQLANLIPVVLTLWSLSSLQAPPLSTSRPSPETLNLSAKLTIPLFTFLSLSRLGLWIFDLTTQQLTQTLVPAAARSTFGGVENSFVSMFELTNYMLALIWSRPQEFRYLAAASAGAVALAAIAYASWVRGVRGHLVHWERVGKCGCGREK